MESSGSTLEQKRSNANYAAFIFYDWRGIDKEHLLILDKISEILALFCLDSFYLCLQNIPSQGNPFDELQLNIKNYRDEILNYYFVRS